MTSLSSLDVLLEQTGAVMDGVVGHPRDNRLRVGVDLGTTFTVVIVTDGTGWPLAGGYAFADVVRDGVVVDFRGATDLVRRLKSDVEKRLGAHLSHAASGYPPGVGRAEVRAVEHVLDAAGMRCTQLVDEPTAANTVLRVRNGAVVDIGGGTTGIAVLSDGELVAVSDETTGGTHVSLVIAGALGLSFAAAEDRKCDAGSAVELFPLVRPVFEKIASIVRTSIEGYDVEHLYLVGGSSRFPGIAQVIGDTVGVPTTVPRDPMFVTALGLAGNDIGTE